MTYHIPVLLNEITHYLDIRSDDVVLDGTLGGGGYALNILSQEPGVREYIGLDQDTDALDYVKKNISDPRLTLIHGNFSEFDALLSKQQLNDISKIVLDLGISSYQIDNPERGFSYMNSGPLDMRMNRSVKETAADVLNNYSEENIADMIYNYGEEPKSRIIAREIIAYRAKEKFSDTGQLVTFLKEIVYGHYPRKMTAVKRVFQALRIEVNNELGILDEALSKMIHSLPENGRLVVVTFHSLEDRIVKKVFNRFVGNQDLPEIKKCTKKVVKPSKQEISRNKRSKSAKLRAIQKI